MRNLSYWIDKRTKYVQLPEPRGWVCCLLCIRRRGFRFVHLTFAKTSLARLLVPGLVLVLVSCLLFLIPYSLSRLLIERTYLFVRDQWWKEDGFFALLFLLIVFLFVFRRHLAVE